MCFTIVSYFTAQRGYMLLNTRQMKLFVSTRNALLFDGESNETKDRRQQHRMNVIVIMSLLLMCYVSLFEVAFNQIRLPSST